MILAVDTATRSISVALATADRLVAEETWQSDNNHTMELGPAVVGLLATAGIKPQDLTALAVAIGPGSFTGVRIGLGFAKGLALACDLPVVGVRTLDIAVAALPQTTAHAIAVAQAGRSRVIWADYVVSDGVWHSESDGVVGIWDTVAAQAGERQATVVGEVDEAGAARLQQAAVRVASAEQNVRRAGRLAAIGWQRWQAGQASPAGAVKPLYAQQPTSGTA